jgi:hypothetical protein
MQCPHCGAPQKWDMIPCRKCQRLIKSINEFCTYCGASQKTSASICCKCGHEIESDQLYQCRACGAQINPALEYQKPARKKMFSRQMEITGWRSGSFQVFLCIFAVYMVGQIFLSALFFGSIFIYEKAFPADKSEAIKSLLFIIIYYVPPIIFIGGIWYLKKWAAIAFLFWTFFIIILWLAVKFDWLNPLISLILVYFIITQWHNFD